MVLDAVVEKKLVLVALVSVVLPLKMLVLENVLAVVVLKDVEKTPVAELYARGKVAEKDESDARPKVEVAVEIHFDPFHSMRLPNAPPAGFGIVVDALM